MAVVVTALLMTLTALLVDPHTVLHTPFALLYPLTVDRRRVDPGRRRARPGRAVAPDRGRGPADRPAQPRRAGGARGRAHAIRRRSPAGRWRSCSVTSTTSRRSTTPTATRAATRYSSEVAARLSHTLEHEPVFRLGGEEFLVLLADVDAGEAQNVAERLRASLRHDPDRRTARHDVVRRGLLARGRPWTTSGCSPGPTPRCIGPSTRAATGWPVPARPLVPLCRRRRPPANVVAFDRRRSKRGAAPALAAPMPSPCGPTPAIAWPRSGPPRAAGWCSDDVEREHLVDLGRRIHQRNRPAYIVTFGCRHRAPRPRTAGSRSSRRCWPRDPLQRRRALDSTACAGPSTRSAPCGWSPRAPTASASACVHFSSA